MISSIETRKGRNASRPATPFLPGYEQPVALHQGDFVRLGTAEAAEALACFTDRIALVPLGLSEIAPASECYPVVFAEVDGAAPGVYALTGIEQGQNLFCEGGHWNEGLYVPAYIRRYPFVTLPASGEPCIEASFVSHARGNGFESLVDDEGGDTVGWTRYKQFLAGFDADIQAAFAWVRRLNQLGLLESRAQEIGLAHELVINQRAYASMAREDIVRLFHAKQLQPIEHQRASQRHFGELLRRHRERMSAFA